MKMVILAVRDSAMDAFMNPFAAPAVGLAARSFSDEVNKPDSPMNGHPEDYDLFELGEFDQQSGRLTSLESPRQIVRGRDVFRKAE